MLFLSQLTHWLQQLSNKQKVGILYCFFLFFVSFFLPIIQIQHINWAETENIYLLQGDFIIVAILFVAVLVKCMIYIYSLQYKSLVLHITWLKIEWYAVPLICFVIMSCIILSIWTTTIVLKNNFTYMINLAYWYYMICALLIIWISVLGLMIVKQLKQKPNGDTIVVSKYQPSNHINRQFNASSRSWLFES